MLIVALPVGVEPTWLLFPQLRRNNIANARAATTKAETGNESRDSVITHPQFLI